MITKSDFMLYLDSPMHLWADKHNRLEQIVPTGYARHLMEQGKDIEKLAEEYIRKIVTKRYNNPALHWQKTFSDRHFQVRTDAVIFDTEAQTHDIYEIKSATSVKKEHKYDVIFQRLVCEATIPVRNVFLVHLNKEYARNGELDIAQLFVVDDITEEVENFREEVKATRAAAWQDVNQNAHHSILECTKPKTCPCPQLCHPRLPEYPIYDLARLNPKKARDLKARGILSIEDIPENYKLSEKQKRQLRAVKSGNALIDRVAIKNELAKLRYPLYFLDYETYNPAVPAYDGYHPYQHMVFQYSLHVFESADSQPQHFEFLATNLGDPGIKIVAHLAKHIGQTGSVIVWNKTFETSRNKEMAAMYPEYGDLLLGVNERIYDLADIFSKGYYVHPDFHGSYSIKSVLPVLVQGFSYAGLNIPKGDEAMLAWLEIISGVLPNEQLEKTKKDLLEYCKLDTLAMVKNWEVLARTVLEVN